MVMGFESRPLVRLRAAKLPLYEQLCLRADAHCANKI